MAASAASTGMSTDEYRPVLVEHDAAVTASDPGGKTRATLILLGLRDRRRREIGTYRPEGEDWSG